MPEIEDRMMTILALTHHIQNRIVGAMAKGKMSQNVAREIASHCEAIADAARRASE